MGLRDRIAEQAVIPSPHTRRWPWLVGSVAAVALAGGALASWSHIETPDGPLSETGLSGVDIPAVAATQTASDIERRVALIGADGDLSRSLSRAGIGAEESAMVAAAWGEPLPKGQEVNLVLGEPDARGVRPLMKVQLRPELGLNVVLERSGDGFAINRRRLAVAATPKRVQGDVSAGLYWSLRRAGVSPVEAGEYLKALGALIDVGTVQSGDSFDMVILQKQAADGQEGRAELLYAGLKRVGDGNLDLVKWSVGGEIQWVDANGEYQAEQGLGWPIAAPVSSNYGMRRHPILKYSRMHRGMDFAASYGSPVYAASSGTVRQARWNGGHGRQVKLDHGDGLATGYSHLSQMVVAPGEEITRGQLIGYVGSSGMSTGPHLHYEVYANGRSVDPRTIDKVRAPLLTGDALKAVQAKRDQLLAQAPLT